jgi:hypothetical protein
MRADMTDPAGLASWHVISQDHRYADLPPLQRFVQAVRDQSKTAAELLDQAFALCEANVEISRMEYAKWQGLCVVDAVGVFSLEGLGGDLCLKYGYDFWAFLRAMAELARRSIDAAQYHQCINHNLFSSPADDSLVLEQMRAMGQSSEIRSRGCMVDTGKLLDSLLKTNSPYGESQEDTSNGQLTRQLVITARNNPEAFRGFGRSLKLDMDGEVFVKGPFCLNVWLERPYFWLASIRLKGEHLLVGGLELQYKLKLGESTMGPVRLLMTADLGETSEPGRAERHFWLHDAELPHDAACGVDIAMNVANWQSVNGHPREAYGQKCRTANAALVDRRPVELVLVVDASCTSATPNGELTLPTLKAVGHKAGPSNV